MVVPAHLVRYRERLLQLEKEVEEEVEKIKREGLVRQSDYGSDGQGQFIEARDKTTALLNQALAKKNKIRRRVGEIDAGVFDGNCRQCGNVIEEEVLDRDATGTRNLCIKCQMEVNGRKR